MRGRPPLNLTPEEKRQRALVRMREWHKRKLKEDPEFRKKHIERSKVWNLVNREKHKQSTDSWLTKHPEKRLEYNERARQKYRLTHPIKPRVRTTPKLRTNHALQTILRKPKPQMVIQTSAFSEIDAILKAEEEKKKAIARKRRQLIYGY